ncbi:stage II sporulation protein M [Candidatus Woesearchaeota archaeon]|jgi:uncharacterized membrane protein SpoIIM required for sporulation|nr:stage II sporulation protein M [Candidatus Woesearchaeota archaeon]MBT5397450.1 stage II sporulation protein M [Candidatus Woesearchaeota archaeon]MBT6367750.1 stage II sporulation protein M [Candidatus Woesearchaeota archaeon]MBT7762849.1 stage II sporulation protein M [Candidatus Woesearchaeota archaeon]
MVLESLFNPFGLKKRPWQMFIAGFVYSLIAFVLSYIVFRDAAGLLLVFLVVLSTLPILYTAIRNEEELDLKYTKEWKLLKEHTKVLVFFMFLFLGITAGLVFSYIAFPSAIVDTVFSLQNEAIVSVNNNVQANITGGITKINLFGKIFMNNIKVLFFCLIFSFLYGSGAIFILTWNASVIAAAMGNIIKTELAKVTTLVGLSSASAYLGVTTFSFFRYMTHGLLEIAAYFVAGLAGGIISIAIIKHNLKENRVLIDVLDLVLISVGLLLIAGVVEVYITPVLFG